MANKLAEEDKHIGSRIKYRRTELKLTQEALVDRLKEEGWILQQGQLSLYETGEMGISASRLYYMARALGVRPNYFYAGLPFP